MNADENAYKPDDFGLNTSWEEEYKFMAAPERPTGGLTWNEINSKVTDLLLADRSTPQASGSNQALCDGYITD